MTLMKLAHYSIAKLKKEILDIVGERLDLRTHRVFFFGSRAEGKGSERSDIDVGIEGETPISSSVLADIKEEFENLPTLYKIDVVDFGAADKIFREVALSHREAIHEPIP